MYLLYTEICSLCLIINLHRKYGNTTRDVVKLDALVVPSHYSQWHTDLSVVIG